MFFGQTTTSLFMIKFYATQAASSFSTEATQPRDQKCHQPTQLPQNEDDEIFDDYLDEAEREALLVEKRKFAKYCLSFIHIGRDVTQRVLEYSTTYDLCARVRGINRDFRNVVSTSNGWFVRRLMPSRGVADCVQVVQVMMHTYIYGKDIHEKALRREPCDPKVSDDEFFGCATRLWAYEDATKTRFGGFPTMHEVVMTWCHGLEFLSNQLLRLLLTRLGMDEKNLSAKDRRKLRKMYLEYKEKLEKDGLRMANERQRQELGMSGFDWRWLDEIENDSSEKDEAMYPICYVHPNLRQSTAQQRIDPLVMMGSLRNREMSRRFCRLFVDLDGTTPMTDDDFKDVRACFKSYILETVKLGQEKDVPFIQALLTNVGTRTHIALSPELVTSLIIDICKGRSIRRRVLVMNSLCGFDMDWDSDEKSVKQRLLFAHALLPMCLSRIGESVRASPTLTKALRALEPKGDEDDALKKELKHMFWSCF